MMNRSPAIFDPKHIDDKATGSAASLTLIVRGI
jgi:hypothetical protein